MVRWRNQEDSEGTKTDAQIPGARMKRKPKSIEPSLRERLSQSFLEALEADFRLHGKGILEQMRQTHPERYAELAGKLIISAEPLAKNDFASANSMEEIGIRLLEAIGISRDLITPNMIEQAIAAQSQFNEKLEQIAEAGGYKQDWH